MEQLFQHFRKDEQPFIEQVSGWVREVQDRYAPKLTDFLDPRQRFIVQSIVGQTEELILHEEGAFQTAERKRVMIAPSYYEPQFHDFDISIWQIQYPTKFVTLTHRDVLGSFMSLGMDRNKLGDIRVQQNTIQFALTNEIASYVQVAFEKIGKVKVHLEEVEREKWLPIIEEEWTEQLLTVSSLRLDTVLSTIFHLSREKATNLITSGRVKVNWTVREEKSFEVHESDLLSVRGFGRVKIGLIDGRTKKDKVRLHVMQLTDSTK